ncbi:MAG: hypothetical protein ACXVPQ_06255, partial [Bacteroidia bacterium]
VAFKGIRHYIQFITKSPAGIEISPVLEEAFKKSNPESYFTWQILGDYYKSKKKKDIAIQYYQTALQKEIATLKEKRQIEESIAECKP